MVNDMEVSIYLFNLDRYSRVVEPAINSYVAQSDPGPVLKLIDQIRASEVPLIEHPRSWPMFKAGAFLGIESVLTGTASYSSSRRAILEGADRSPMSLEDREGFALHYFANALTKPLCVPWNPNRSPKFLLAGTALEAYLKAHVPLLHHLWYNAPDLLDGVSPKYSFGRTAKCFSTANLARLRKELSTPSHRRESPSIAKDIEQLQTMLSVIDESQMTLIYVLEL